MDHGRYGPQGVLGGGDGGVNRVVVRRDGKEYIPPHLSKDQDILIGPGDQVRVSTPGGGGYGNPFERDPQLVATDVERGYYRPEEASELFGVVLSPNSCDIDVAATKTRRNRRR